jgi:hypothetical protein
MVFLKIKKIYFVVVFRTGNFFRNLLKRISIVINILKDQLIIFWKFIKRIKLLGLLEPSKITVDEYWLNILEHTGNGHFSITSGYKPPRGKKSTLEFIVSDLNNAWIGKKNPNSETCQVPIWCLNNLNPYAEGVRSFLIPHMSRSLHKQIASLMLQEPIEVRTMIRSDSVLAISKSVIDITPERIIIIGNTGSVLQLIENLGSRMSFPKIDPISITERLRNLILTYHIDPVGTSLFVGGFGAVFGFEASFFYTKIFEFKVVQPLEIIITMLGMLAVIFFLFEQAFESRISAFAPRWTLYTQILSWSFFLLFILGGGVVIFGQPDARELISWFRIFSLLLIASCLSGDLGRIFFNSGLNKLAAVVLWLFLFVTIYFLQKLV